MLDKSILTNREIRIPPEKPGPWIPLKRLYQYVGVAGYCTERYYDASHGWDAENDIKTRP